MTPPDPVIHAEYLTVHGSRSYGLNRPDSDWDFRGFFMPSPEHVLGFQGGPEQRQVQTPELDVVAWDIRKFFRLAAAANPNVIETLFTDPEDRVRVGKYAGRVLGCRRSFLSKKALNTFGGYAISQLKKVRTSNWDDAGCRKDAMHLMRLLYFGQQILADGDLQLKGSTREREFLVDLRRGLFSRDHVIALAETELKRLEELGRQSLLPESPDLQALNGILIEIMQDHLKETT